MSGEPRPSEDHQRVETKPKKIKGPRFLVEVQANTFLKAAQEFSKRFEVSSSLGLGSDQLNLFNLYFARYHLLKHPLNDVPLLGTKDFNLEAVKILDERIEKQEGDIVESTRHSFGTGVDSQMNEEEQQRLLEKLILDTRLTFRDIQLLANILSSVTVEYRRSKNKTKEARDEFRRRVREIIGESSLRRNHQS